VSPDPNNANPLIFLNLKDSVHILDAKTLKPLHVIEGMGTVIMSATKAL